MRRALLLSCGLLLAAACSDDESAPPPAGNSPFDGVSWVAPDREGRLVVSWKALPTAKSYRVYSSLHEGRALKKAAVATTSDTTIVLAPETKGEKHFIAVRAVDDKGLEDANTVEKSATAAPDTTPPQFGGAKEVTPVVKQGATVKWDPATDDASPPDAIAYDVFAGRTPTTMVQIGRTKRGETSFTADTLGKPAEQLLFAVRARDIGDNLSTELKTLAGALGGDIGVPTFGGCEAVSDVETRSAVVTWKPASDDFAPVELLQYEIYTSPTPGAQDFTAAPLAKVTNATSIALKDLEPGKTYNIVCRVRDNAGNMDTNKTEKAFTTLGDVTAPVFDGLQNAVVDSSARTAQLSWNAAVDDKTDPAKIVYDVFETKASGVYDFTKPKMTTAAGATSVDLTNLEPRSTLSWVVRARDEAKNSDQNKKEKSGEIKTSFSVNVQPIFERSCAVVGCHVTGIAPAGLNLAPAFAYDNLVGVNASLIRPPAPPKKRVAQGVPDPLGASFLWEKINPNPSAGAQMPAPQTGSTLSQDEKAIINSWILEGAVRN